MFCARIRRWGRRLGDASCRGLRWSGLTSESRLLVPEECRCPSRMRSHDFLLAGSSGLPGSPFARLYRLTGGRLGLWRTKPNGWGAMRLNTDWRRTGLERSVMVGYFEDGPNLVTMAMNGWGEGEPAWWLNMQAHPDARVDLPDGPRLVTGRTARGEERERL
ncbi:MAG: nitroreductase/quinone reductase family protein [Actinomycetota bacterium]